MMAHIEIAFMRIELFLIMEITQQFHDERVRFLEQVGTALLKEECTKEEAADFLGYIELSRSLGVLDDEDLKVTQEFLELIIEGGE